MQKTYGKYVRKFSDDYVVLDLETTGLSPNESEIIEIGMIRVRSGVPVDSLQVLVRPKRLPIPSFIEQLTGIQSAWLYDAPTLEQVQEYVLDFMEGELLAGYNTAFDLKFLSHHFGQNFDNEYIDVMRFAKKMYPNLARHRLTDMVAHLQVRNNAHRAMADCIATMDVYETIKKSCQDQNMSLEELFKRKSH
jgi:DNA polymerase III epsilon subunit family exonuclease